MSDSHAGESYGASLVGMLQLVWGEGWLSPGGPEEVDRALAGIPIAGRRVLDIGSGVGGIDLHLVEAHGAAEVVGIDVEDALIAAARRAAAERGLDGRIRFLKVVPGRLPFDDASFDVVFSKDSIIHIPDKQALMRDVFRVLRPGGWFAASDWLLGHEGEPSEEMRAYIAAEGLDFGIASRGRYRAALTEAGFVDIAIESRNAWYRERARRELAEIRGPLYAPAVARLGRDEVERNVEIWTRMVRVLETGEHCPSHLRGRRPA